MDKSTGSGTHGRNNVVAIIDGNSLINRAYYAMQKPMITKEGLYTQGVYGFINMLNRLLKEYEPGYIAVAFDLKAPTFRHQQYSEYKAGRKKMPIELAMQMPILKDVLKAMNIAIYELEGFEADDIIGTIAKRGEAEGYKPLIITGDKDALQLASQKTKVLITKKGISEFELFDDEKMQEVYGLTPLQFIDYKGLRGDTSDNIPGVPGVGEKTALNLLHEFGTLENLLEKSDEISSPKLKEKIQDNRQQAIMSKMLATIDTNVPINLDFKDVLREEPDYDKLIDIYVKLEFNSFLKRMQTGGSTEALGSTKASGSASGSTKAGGTSTGIGGTIASAGGGTSTSTGIGAVTGVSTDPAAPFECTYQPKTEEEIMDMLTACPPDTDIFIKVFSDNNHKGIPEITGMSLCLNGVCCFINGSNREAVKKATEAISERQLPVHGHNLKEDYYALLANFEFTRKDVIFNTAFDTAVAEYLIAPTKSNYRMKTLSLEYLHREVQAESDFLASTSQMDMFSDSSKQYAEYGADVILAAGNIENCQKAQIAERDLSEVFEKLELPLVEVMASMEKEGFALDAAELKEIGKGIKDRIDQLTKDIHQACGSEFNINSPSQLGKVLFEDLKLPAGKKTKTGYSTNAEVLEKLMGEHPVIPMILEYRTLTKLNGTYIEGLLPLQGADGKIHAHFQQTVTATGRISCTEPNLQNIPIKQELGRTIRKAFVPGDKGNVLVGADYSQIELRILAALSGEEQLIQAFNDGADIHRLTASKVFNVPFDQVTSLQRSNAKAVNFGVIYGMSGFGLSTELNITRKEAEMYIKDYFQKYAKVKEYMDLQVKNCKSHGYITTIMGRRREIPEITASNFMVRSLGERLAMNTPIQGSAADIIKLAMISVYARLRREGLKTKLILQVHDELILEVPTAETETAKALLKECMENAMTLPVKLTAELEIGNNWYELK